MFCTGERVNLGRQLFLANIWTRTWLHGECQKYPLSSTVCWSVMSVDLSLPLHNIGQKGPDGRGLWGWGGGMKGYYGAEFIYAVDLWNSQPRESHHRERHNNKYTSWVLQNRLENFMTAEQQLYKRSKVRLRTKRQRKLLPRGMCWQPTDIRKECFACAQLLLNCISEFWLD